MRSLDTYEAELEMRMRVRERLREAENWRLARLAKSYSRPDADRRPAAEGWRVLAERARLAWDSIVCSSSGLALARVRARTC